MDRFCAANGSCSRDSGFFERWENRCRTRRRAGKRTIETLGDWRKQHGYITSQIPLKLSEAFLLPRLGPTTRSLFLFLFIRKSEQLNGAQFGDQAEGDVIEKKSDCRAPAKLTLFREESLKLSRNALIGLASFLIRFQLHLADIFAGSFSRILPLGERKKRGERKSTVRCEKPFRSFSPSSIHVSFLTFHRNHSPFAVSPHLRYRPRLDARNSLEFFVSLLPSPFLFFFFFVSLSTVDFQLFRVNAVAIGHHASRRQSLDIRPDLSNSAAISICYEVDSTG